VFVSSHLLGEVEQMCTDVGIVKGGRLLRQEPVSALAKRGAGIELCSTDVEGALAVLRGLDFVVNVTRDGDGGRLLVDAPRQRAADLSRALADRQIYLSELRAREGTLEDFFLEVTGESDAER
jgi:ABC-2 type transport system ATP-binding protein